MRLQLGFLVVVLALQAGVSAAVTIRVPADYTTIQAALDVAGPGDVIEVASSVYYEKIEFPSSGAVGNPITLTAAPGQTPVLDGTGVSGENMVLIDSQSYVAIVGFVIRNNTGVSDGSGIRVLGAGVGITISDNVISEIRGSDAMGITVYATEPSPIQDLVITSNQVFDCDPAESEAITLNGNVAGFEVSNNLVRDVNNIGIDFIGGETDIQPDPALVVRDGVVRGNTVIRANSVYGGGYAGGIYVDGGRNIVIENNLVTESDLGIEIGAENSGLITENIIVRNNLVFRNERAGIVFGGYEHGAGRANNNQFRGNTLYENNTVGEDGQGTHFVGGGIGELWIQFAASNIVENNIFYAGPENIFVGSFDAGSSVGNALNYNLYFSAEGVGNGEFSSNGSFYTGLGEWQTATGNDTDSLAMDPNLSDPPNDFHLVLPSPAIDTGNPGFTPEASEVDLDGQARMVGGRVDIGVDEYSADAIFADGFESGDTSAWDSGFVGA